MAYRWTLTNLKTLDYEVLSADPIGWDEATYTLSRSDRYKSVMHEYSTPLKFHCKGGGKDFIDSVYETDAIDGRIDILIEYDCDGRGSYDTLFNGIVNLATYTVENDYTICQIERSDLYTKFINRDEISVDLETTVSIGGQTITTVDSRNLTLPSSEIIYADEWVIPDTYLYTTDEFEYDSSEVFTSWTSFAMNLQVSDIDTATSGVEYTDLHTAVFESNYIEPLVTFNEPSIIYPITINWEIDFKGVFSDIQSNAPAERTNAESRLVLYWGIKNDSADGSIHSQVLYDNTGYTDNNYTHAFDIVDSGSFSVGVGWSIWLTWVVQDKPTDPANNAFIRLSWDFERSFFRFNTSTFFKATNAKSFLIHEAFNQITDAIADSDGNFVSNFYGRIDSQKRTYSENGCGALIGLTNGINIREFENKIISASFRELFDAMDCIHNIGAGYVNGKIQVEPLSYWYDNTTRIISLPFVNRYNRKDDNRRYFNKIEIGAQRWESEFHGGLDDVSAKHEYSTIIASAKNVYQKLCKYLTSSYTIEFTRRKNYQIISTEDWRYDNDNFLIALKDNFTSTLERRISFNAGTNIININLAIPQFTAGDIIEITNSTSNNGTYTVLSAAAYYDPDYTVITVNGPLTNESTAGSVIRNLTTGLAIVEWYSDSFTAGSGMVQLETAYNLRLTPARMLLAHLNVITAGLQKIKGFVKFVKGDGNTALQLTKTDVGCQEDFDGQPLAENQSIEWSDDRARNIRPLWFPEIYSFEYPLTYEQFKTIKDNPNGYIEFYRFENDKKAGYILNMEYQLKTGMTKFELLRIYAPEASGDEKGNYIGDETGALIGNGGG